MDTAIILIIPGFMVTISLSSSLVIFFTISITSDGNEMETEERVYAMGDVYPESTKLPKGDYQLQLYIRHDNVQYLERMKQLVLFIERYLEEKEFMRLSFFSQPDGPVMGNGSFKSSDLVPGISEAFYLAPPTKDKLPKNCPVGSVLLGAISYKKPSAGVKETENNPLKQTVSYQISYVVAPNKLDEEKAKDHLHTCTKSVTERLEEEVRDTKIRFLASLKQATEEERSQYKELSACLKSEYPNYTPLLSKILEGLLSRSGIEDKILYNQEVIEAANEVVNSIDKDELAKFFSMKCDPEDDEAEKIRKKMEATREQLVEALYRKGLSLSEIETIKGKEVEYKSTTGSSVDDLSTSEESGPDSREKRDLFEENLKELKRWVEVKSSKYSKLLVFHEKRNGRLGTALKVVNDAIQEEGEPAKKQLYDLKLALLEEIGWSHLVSYEKRWMHIRFPLSLPLF